MIIRDFARFILKRLGEGEGLIVYMTCLRLNRPAVDADFAKFQFQLRLQPLKFTIPPAQPIATGSRLQQRPPRRQGPPSIGRPPSMCPAPPFPGIPDSAVKTIPDSTHRAPVSRLDDFKNHPYRDLLYNVQTIFQIV